MYETRVGRKYKNKEGKFHVSLTYFVSTTLLLLLYLCCPPAYVEKLYILLKFSGGAELCLVGLGWT